MAPKEEICKAKAAFTSSSQMQAKFYIKLNAVFSLIHSDDLAKIGATTYQLMDFYLADGNKIIRKVSNGYFEYNGEGGAAPVIFCEPDHKPLLGAPVLEVCTLILMLSKANFTQRHTVQYDF